MGLKIDRERFADADYARFTQRLHHSLHSLRDLLRRPDFGIGAPTIGAELELVLVDRSGRPLLDGESVLEQCADPRLAMELGRFNLELNLTPRPLAGRPFSALSAELTALLGRVAQAVDARGGQVVPIGILPTLRRHDLTHAAISDAARYRALQHGIRRLRGTSFRIAIGGAEPMRVVTDDVAMEGANTSWQVHLRVDPREFAATYNATQAATAPALAVAGNSPIFLGHRLWQETRVALFEQAVDDRDRTARSHRVGRVSFGTGWVRQSALELFEEGVRTHHPLLPVIGEAPPPKEDAARAPDLPELRLHQGTVWRWNRAVYDPGDGGHLRIEMRALPAGPTIPDMLANTAFLLGLTIALASDAGWTEQLPFGRVRGNFYRAARHGLNARLAWPGQSAPITARDLIPLLVPLARDGLAAAGVAGPEIAELLGIIEARARLRRTGARWQLQALAALERDHGRGEALAALVRRYAALSGLQHPVHTWPDPAVLI